MGLNDIDMIKFIDTVQSFLKCLLQLGMKVPSLFSILLLLFYFGDLCFSNFFIRLKCLNFFF
jgi:hypothetical protein